MKLFAPATAPALELVDIYGKAIPLGGTGRRTLLSFFRDAACPFCNFRIYELTHHHQSLAALGLDIVAVFGSSQAEVVRFVARHPRPFRVAADPIGLAGFNTNNLMPADFLIDEEGRIVETYYGSDAGDRIPLERVELFLARGLIQRGAPAAAGPVGNVGTAAA
jgi:peroxiredoxin